MSRRNLMALAAATALAAAFAPPVTAQTPSYTIIGRGGSGTTSDLAFTVMEEALRRAHGGEAVSIRRLPGTASATPPRVQSREAEIGHGVGESVLDAWTGTRTFEGREPMRDLRYLGSYLGFLNRPSASPTFVTTEGNPVQSWADLADKRIGVGPPDSLTSTMVNVALGGVGLSYEAIEANGGLVHTGDWNQQMEMLGDGQLDAVFFTGDHPAPVVTQFAANNRARLVTMSDDVLEALLAAYPTFTANEMDGGTYDWQSDPVMGVQLSLGYIVHADMDEELVYNLCQQLYVGDNARIWGEVVPGWAGAEAQAHRAAATVFIPLHPGAQRCFEEAGIEISFIGAGEDTP